jgi:hypothetical protein
MAGKNRFSIRIGRLQRDGRTASVSWTIGQSRSSRSNAMYSSAIAGSSPYPWSRWPPGTTSAPGLFFCAKQQLGDVPRAESVMHVGVDDLEQFHRSASFPARPA